MNKPNPNNNDYVNIASYLTRTAKTQPHKRAVVCPAGRDKKGRIAYSHLTFIQLDQESDCLAHGLTAAGITHGTRTVLMVKPSLDFFTLIFALFKTGAVPVVVDPGMGIQRMVGCFKSSVPRHLSASPWPTWFGPFTPNFLKPSKPGSPSVAAGSGEASH